MDIHPDEQRDIHALRENGWWLVDPQGVVPTPSAFREYVRGSGAEFSVAQGAYVETSSGWFSDRTVRYLASGQPVVVQETGFSENMPTGDGLLSFRTLFEAAGCVARVAHDYDHHARAAREIAESHFDSDQILGRLADETGIAP